MSISIAPCWRPSVRPAPAIAPVDTGLHHDYGQSYAEISGPRLAGGDNTALIDAVRVAAAGGNVINLTSVVTGSTTNYTLTTSSTHSGNFAQASFSASPSGATLTGGLNAGDLIPILTLRSIAMTRWATCTA